MGVVRVCKYIESSWFVQNHFALTIASVPSSPDLALGFSGKHDAPASPRSNQARNHFLPLIPDRFEHSAAVARNELVGNQHWHQSKSFEDCRYQGEWTGRISWRTQSSQQATATVTGREPHRNAVCVQQLVVATTYLKHWASVACLTDKKKSWNRSQKERFCKLCILNCFSCASNRISEACDRDRADSTLRVVRRDRRVGLRLRGIDLTVWLTTTTTRYASRSHEVAAQPALSGCSLAQPALTCTLPPA